MDIDHVFKYHSPTEEQQAKYVAIRDAAKVFATVLELNAPPCADRSSALRHVRNAVMEANAAIALDGRLD